MPGKRKRDEKNSLPGANDGSLVTNDKPISAIAAARLKAAALQESVVGSSQEILPSPTSESLESDISDLEPGESSDLVARNFTLCSWHKTGKNVISDTGTEITIVLEKHETVAFVGCCIIDVLKGAVNINGANLSTPMSQEGKTKKNRIFAASIYPLFKIRGLDRKSQIRLVHCTEPSPLAKISPLFAGIWAANPAGSRSFQMVLQSNADPLKRPLLPEAAPEDWLRSIETISGTQSTTLVVGPSSSGKNTLMRRLLNRYLTGLGKTAKAVPSVCFLDLDWSNPEYTPHGQISLTLVQDLNLGPSFAHPVIPTRLCGNKIIASHPIPVRNYVDYEDYVMSCVSHLIAEYHNLPSEEFCPPLLINTGGSFYEAHPFLLQNFLTITKPKHIVHLGESEITDQEIALKLQNLQTQAQAINATFHELKAQHSPLPPSRTEAERRSMVMQSYFHQQLSPADETTWDTRPLSHFTPWEYCYCETTSRSQDLIGILQLFEPLSPNKLLTTLNGSIVQIVETDCPSTQGLYRKLPTTPTHRIPYFSPDPATGKTEPLDPRTSRLVCLALIRGVDLESKLLQVVVPNAYDELLYNLTPEKTVLVAGCCDIPGWAYTEDAYHFSSARSEHGKGSQLSLGRDAMMEGFKLPPWVEKKNVMDGMGYLNTVRRVRKFLG